MLRLSPSYFQCVKMKTMAHQLLSALTWQYKRDPCLASLELLDAEAQSPGNQWAVASAAEECRMQTHHGKLLMGRILDFVFQIKWGQTETQAVED